jgi:hypothetical protein
MSEKYTIKLTCDRCKRVIELTADDRSKEEAVKAGWHSLGWGDENQFNPIKHLCLGCSHDMNKFLEGD